MAEELKPCPFCGGAVRFHSDEDCHGCHYIECGGCKAMFDFSPTTDPENQCDSLHELQCGIARTWNTRATRPAPASAGGVEAERITVVSITGNIQAVAAADYDSLKAERDRLQEELADLHNASSAPTEKVEVVGYAGFHQLELRRLLPQYPGMKVKKEPGERYTEPLMTVTQHQRILAASAGSAEPVAWREHSVNYAKGEKCPETIETLQAAWDRNQELINDMRHEIARHKTRINRLEQRRPSDQVADDLTMVKVSRELLQDLRDLAFDQVEHHRAAMTAYKQTRQSAMDSVLAQADALLEVKP